MNKRPGIRGWRELQGNSNGEKLDQPAEAAALLWRDVCGRRNRTAYEEAISETCTGRAPWLRDFPRPQVGRPHCGGNHPYLHHSGTDLAVSVLDAENKALIERALRELEAEGKPSRR
jgi:hypothetical protein